MVRAHHGPPSFRFKIAPIGAFLLPKSLFGSIFGSKWICNSLRPLWRGSSEVLGETDLSSFPWRPSRSMVWVQVLRFQFPQSKGHREACRQTQEFQGRYLNWFPSSVQTLPIGIAVNFSHDFHASPKPPDSLTNFKDRPLQNSE